MRRRTALNIFLALAMVLVLATGCEDAQQTADLKITLTENASRTLNPAGADFEVAKYHVVCQDAAKSADPIEIDTVRTSLTIQGLPVGSYNIIAYGRNAAGENLIQGSSTFELSATNTAAVVTLKEMVGTGGLDIDFTWDSSLISNPSISVTLTAVDGQSYVETTESLTISGGSAKLSKSGLPTGSYRLVASLFSGKTRVAGCVEAIRIGNNGTVEADLTFNLDELPDSAGQITLVNNAGVPVACTISGLSDTIQAQKSVTVSLAADGIDTSSLDVDWYLDGEYIGATTQTTFMAAPGKHRLDVIASTSKLGSTGSTTVTFEAALLGETGVPVLGGLITENKVEGLGLDTDMLVTFLPEGYLLIIDNSTKSAQIASVKRNLIEIVGTTTLPNKITHAVAVSGTTRVAMAYDTAETAIYSYNVGTGKLTFQYSDAKQIIKGNTSNLMTKIYGLMPKGHKDNNFFVLGKAYSGSKYLDMLAAHDAVTESEQYGTYNVIQSVSIDYDIFAVINTGEDAVLIDKDSSTTSLLFTAPDTNYPRVVSAVQSFTKPTAAQCLPASNANTFRYVVADGDSFRYFERDRTKMSGAAAFLDKGTLNRSEGSSLNTVQLLLSYGDGFLYALNQGNNSISTYSVSSSGVLTYVGSTDLTFTPKSATLSANNEYMAVAGTGGELCLMRIKTST